MMLREVLATQFRVLSFRGTIEALPVSPGVYLSYAALVTWVVGLGRYWDSPDVHLLQRLGVGSLAYLFALSALLWVAIAPIAKRPISYFLLVIFVGLTAIPALLYAIPVEMVMSVPAAATTNYIFLAIVAVWRVALLLLFCRYAAGLSLWGSLTATFLPLTGIMIVLAMFSLEHVTFDLMSGLRVDETHPRTAAGEYASGVTVAAGWSHETVGTLSFLSWTLFPIFLISYVILWAKKQR